jgi:hypothetical protein
MQTVTIKVVVGPQKSRDPNSSWDIAALRKKEYCKLPYDQFPVTVNINRDGIGVTLFHAGYQCEASLHRDQGGAFYIGSAKNRLKDNRYTQQYNDFLSNSGFRVAGKNVQLKFSGYKVYMS